MARLTTIPMLCCSPETQLSCCEPEAKEACCGEGAAGGCGCNPRDSGDVHAERDRAVSVRRSSSPA